VSYEDRVDDKRRIAARKKTWLFFIQCEEFPSSAFFGTMFELKELLGDFFFFHVPFFRYTVECLLKAIGISIHFV